MRAPSVNDSRRTAPLTVAEVAAALPAAKRREERLTMWPSAYIYRPISIRLCPMFHRLGFTPTAVTILGLAVILMLPLCLLAVGPSPGEAIAAVLLLASGMAAVEILDNVDGDLARATQRTSAAGACFDAVTGIVFRAVSIAVAGTLVAMAEPDALLGFARHGLALGLGAASLVLLAKLIRNRTEMALAAPLDSRGPTEDDTGPRSFGPAAFILGLEHALPFILPLGAALDILPLVLVAWLTYAAGDLGLAVIQTIRRLT